MSLFTFVTIYFTYTAETYTSWLVQRQYIHFNIIYSPWREYFYNSNNYHKTILLHWNSNICNCICYPLSSCFIYRWTLFFLWTSVLYIYYRCTIYMEIVLITYETVWDVISDSIMQYNFNLMEHFAMRLNIIYIFISSPFEYSHIITGCVRWSTGNCES